MFRADSGTALRELPDDRERSAGLVDGNGDPGDLNPNIGREAPLAQLHIPVATVANGCPVRYGGAKIERVG